MDDLVALFADDEEACNDVSQTVPKSNPKRNSQPAPVEERIGMRLVPRMPEDEMYNVLFLQSNFHSAAQLGAYTTSQLQTFMDNEPSENGGSLQLVTAGVVLHTSPSRVSANGNAIATMTVGNLRTGPIVTVLVCGNALHQQWKKVSLGVVVALTDPWWCRRGTQHLAKKKQRRADVTTITVSVREAEQLQILGTAKDYGRCQEESCAHWVNTRHGRFCAKHAKQHRQQHTSTTTISSSATRKTNNIFEQRRQKRAAACIHAPAHLQNSRLQQQRPLANPYATNRAAPSQNSLLRPSTTASRPSRRPDPRQVTPHPQRTFVRLSLVASHQPKPQKRLNTTTTVVDDGQWNGSVRVPTPRCFGSSWTTATNTRMTTSATSSTFAAVVPSITAEGMRQQQRALAAQLCHRKANASRVTKKKKSKGEAAAKSPPKKDASFADAFGPAETSGNIVEAQSVFCTEADAEHYVQWRQRATELEEREEKQKKKEESSMIRTTWHCCDCERTVAHPRGCLRLGHRVKRQRILPKSSIGLDVAAERQKRKDLILGEGLEWSRRPWEK